MVVTPVLAHLGVKEVLVDRGQLLAKRQVQLYKDLLIAFHDAHCRTGVNEQANMSSTPTIMPGLASLREALRFEP
jgi:hypothetical protein